MVNDAIARQHPDAAVLTVALTIIDSARGSANSAGDRHDVCRTPIVNFDCCFVDISPESANLSPPRTDRCAAVSRRFDRACAAGAAAPSVRAFDGAIVIVILFSVRIYGSLG